jgi:hypothetical protein
LGPGRGTNVTDLDAVTSPAGEPLSKEPGPGPPAHRPVSLQAGAWPAVPSDAGCAPGSGEYHVWGMGTRLRVLGGPHTLPTCDVPEHPKTQAMDGGIPLKTMGQKVCPHQQHGHSYLVIHTCTYAYAHAHTPCSYTVPKPNGVPPT